MIEKDAISEIITSNLENIHKKQKEIEKLSQVNSLASAYFNFKLRNAILEERLKKSILKNKRRLNVYYYTYILDQISYPLLDKINNDNRFELILLVEKRDQFEFLKNRGYNCRIVHSKAQQFPDLYDSGMERFQADICFGEMPYGVLPSLEQSILPSMIAGGWLPKYRDVFPRHELSNSLFCLVHYAYFLANEWQWLISNPSLNVHYSLPYANFCWLYFLESNNHLDFALDRNSFGNTDNYVVTGYPKYDTYLVDPVEPLSFHWKFQDGERRRVVYAPHFIRSEKTLARTCEALLTLADKQTYEIVFKPHPVHNAQANEYAKRFAAHSSCQVVRNSDSSQYIFATSDISIISSVSMHADGLFSKKPYISELGEENFNHIGRSVRAAAYHSDETTDIEAMISGILAPGGDVKRAERDAIRSILAPPPEISASSRIIEAIMQRLS